jgi:2-polyprenyl-6-methoxyphenol hydroxylase-like FAD-dependent oxidoreductase
MRPTGAGRHLGAMQTTPLSEGIAIVGGGPAGLVAAMALARRGIQTTVFEREVHPDTAPRFNPDRSYTIDITGHGLRALRHIDVTPYFDARMLRSRASSTRAGSWMTGRNRAGPVRAATSSGR